MTLKYDVTLASYYTVQNLSAIRTDGRMITDVQMFYGIKFSVEKVEVIVVLKNMFFFCTEYI